MSGLNNKIYSEQPPKSNNIKNIIYLIVVAIAVYLSWNHNQNEPTGMRIFYALIASGLSFVYIIYYVIYHVLMKK